jgi:phytol kinase
MTAADLLKLALLLLAVGAVLGALRVFQVRARPEPELVRKLFHMSGGVAGLSLPWLFDDLAPVLLLGAIVAAAFVALRLVPRLRSGIGQVIFAVERKTVGELCFIASFCLLFWLARGDKLLYSVPLLILVFADALAALIGEQYGRLQMHVSGGRKSHEGAAAFFLTAFFCAHVPVLLWGGTTRLASLMIGVDLAVMVMMAEAAAWWGLDNLIIPVWGYMLLKSLLGMHPAELAAHLAFLLSLGLFMYFWRNRTTLADDALFGATLWGYVVWAVGGWQWVVPPLVQVIIYATITFRTPMDQQRLFGFPVVLAQIAGSMFWLLVFRESGETAVYFPFAACFGANVAIIALVRHKFAVPGLRWRQALSANVAKGMLVIVPAVLAVDGFTLVAALDLAACLLALYAAAALFYWLQPALETFPVDAGRWVRQAAIVAGTSTLSLGIRYGALPRVSLLDVLQTLGTL